MPGVRRPTVSVAAGMLQQAGIIRYSRGGIVVLDRERLEAASADEMLAATEVADLLVRRGVPFREAHGIVGGLVRDAIEREKQLSELSREELKERSEHLDDDFYEVLGRESWLESKRIEGGTASEAVSAQLDRAREALAAVRTRLAQERG
jgi:argininosuccinate lyase